MIKFFWLIALILISPYGGFFFVQKKNPEQKFLSFLLGVAAGTFAFLLFFESIEELLPWSTNSWLALIFLTIGFLSNFFLDRFLPHSEHHHHNHCHHPEKFSHLTTMVTVSLAIHNLIEGAAFGIIALNNEAAATILAIMIVLHNIPLNLALFAPETYIQSSTKHILKHVFLANFPFLIGSMTYFLLTRQLPEEAIIGGTFFAFGMIIYLLGHEIWPIIWQEKEGRKSALLGGIIGLAIVLFISLFE